MTDSIFPEGDIGKYIFEVKYDGPSFKGEMEIGAASKEIAAFERCIEIAIIVLKQEKKLPKDFELKVFVSAFEHGSFKHWVKWANDNPGASSVLAALVGSVIAGTIPLIGQITAAALSNPNGEVISKISNSTHLKLLTDPEYLACVSDIANPLSQEGDSMCLREPTPEKPVIVTFREKPNYLVPVPQEKPEEIQESYGEVFGRIISMDIDAYKNQIEFKVEGKGERIRCTLPEEMNINNYTHLLGKWVNISGRVQASSLRAHHIDVAAIEETDPPESEMRQSSISID